MGNEPIGNGWGETIKPKPMANGASPRKFVVFEDETFFVTTSADEGTEASFNGNRYAVTANGGRIAETGDYELVLANDGITTLSSGSYEFSVTENEGVYTLHVTKTPITDYSALVDYTPALINNNEQSIFLRTKAQTSPYVYASNPDGSELAPWPGQKMSLVGKEAGNTDYYIYKWVSPYSTNLHHSSLTINDGTSNRSTAAKTTLAPYVNFNHHIYNMDGERYNEIKDDGEIIAVTPRTPAPKNAVIYEMSLANFAGNFTAATAKINDLKQNGITIISLMPIYQRDTNSMDPYSMVDQYDATAYGSFDDLKNFITAAHNAGIKVLLDVVVDRTSTQARWVTEYPKCYKRDANGQMIHPVINGVEAQDQYALDLNYTGTQWAIVNALESVMKQLGDAATGNFSGSFDGFRIDNASAIPAPSVSRALNALHALNPSLIILGDIELIDEDPVYHQVGYDYDYSKKLQSTMLTGIGDGSTQDQLRKVNEFVNGLKEASVYTNIVPRTLYTTNHVLNKTNSQAELYGANEKALTVLTYTLSGIPMIYNGQETGYLTSNKIDYTGNATIGDGNDGAMKTLIKALGQLRKDNEAMSADVDVKLKNTNIVDGGIVAFTREYNGDEVLVLFNLSDRTQGNIVVNNVQQAKWKRVLKGDAGSADISEAELDFNENTRFELPAHGYEIYQLNEFFTEDQKGWYVHPQNDPTGMIYKMTKTADNQYEIGIPASKFYEMSQNNEKLVFDLKELKTVNDKIAWSTTNLTPETNLTEVTDGGVAGNDNNSGNKFQITAAANARTYTLTLTVDNGNYTLKLAKTTQTFAGVYLACQANEEGDNQDERYQLTTIDNDDEGYTHHIVITKDNFEQYSNNDANSRLFFHLAVYNDNDGNVEKDLNYVAARTVNGYTFQDTDDRRKYEECARNSNAKTNFFVLEKIRGYASYDIRFLYNERQGITYVKVIYNKDYTWNGNTAEEVAVILENNNTKIPDGAKNVYLYNVDTGKFLWNRGNWGTQAMAPYEAFGLKLNLINTSDIQAQNTAGGNKYGSQDKPSYAFYTGNAGDSKSNTQGAFLGYDQTKYTGGGADRLENAFWVDRGGNLNNADNGTRDASGAFRWHLYPIESGTNDAKTYLLSVELFIDGNYNKAPKEFFVNVGDDPNHSDLALHRNDIKLDELRDAADQPKERAKKDNYRWQLVTEEELLAAFENENADAYAGMYTDATFLFDNPDFARGLHGSVGREAWNWKTNGDNNPDNVYKWDQVGNNAKDGEFFYAEMPKANTSLEQDKKMPVSGVYSIDLNGFSTNDANAKIKVEVTVEGENLIYEKDLMKIDNDEFNRVKNNYREAEDGNRNDGYSIGKTFYVDNQTHYKNTLYFYVPEFGNTAGKSNGNIKVTIERGDGNGTVVVDNFRATYLGEAPFVLKPTETSVQYIKDEDHTKIPVYINRKFIPEAWQAFVLPFDVTVAQLRQAFGNDVQLSEAAGLSEDDYFNILFKKVGLSNPNAVAMQANHFYLIKPAVSRVVTELIKREDTTLTPIKDEDTGYVSLGFHNVEALGSIGTYVEQKYDEINFEPDHNNIRYIGLYAHSDDVAAGSYVFGVKGTDINLFHLSKKSTLDGFRFYIQDIIPDGSSAKPIKYVINDDEELIDDGDGSLTPVDRVVEDGADNVKREGIYTISGQRVSGDVKDLPNGLYIINGEKVLISNK